ncbi:hypothetical protein ABZ896_06770 [Streptomyces sp. NPDC047072]|uniref:hypothetical protein n=1 Tax=Streptomyces sp. NPDC047072 TaxID=3154809 RepID=UPI0033CFC69F
MAESALPGRYEKAILLAVIVLLLSTTVAVGASYWWQKSNTSGHAPRAAAEVTLRLPSHAS